MQKNSYYLFCIFLLTSIYAMEKQNQKKKVRYYPLHAAAMLPLDYSPNYSAQKRAQSDSRKACLVAACVLLNRPPHEKNENNETAFEIAQKNRLLFPKTFKAMKIGHQYYQAILNNSDNEIFARIQQLAQFIDQQSINFILHKFPCLKPIINDKNSNP